LVFDDRIGGFWHENASVLQLAFTACAVMFGPTSSVLVALAGSRSRFSAEELVDCGAFLAEKSRWRDDVSNYLADIESGDNAMAQYAL